MTLAALTLLFNLNTAAYNLPPNLIHSICFVESSYNTKAVNIDDGGEDSLGVCQIKYSTAKWMGFKGTRKQLMQPENNIKYASKFLAYQIKRYNGNVTKGVIAYNRGNAIRLTSSPYSVKVFKQLGRVNVTVAYGNKAR